LGLVECTLQTTLFESTNKLHFEKRAVVILI